MIHLVVWYLKGHWSIIQPCAMFVLFLFLSFAVLGEAAKIDRQQVVSRYNVIRTSVITNTTTPLQVGNGDFAFNVDTTGLQTFLPFNTLSTWAWHNDSLPTNGEKVEDYKGMAMDTHGRQVYYDIPDPQLPEVSQWIISNPNRVNLGRIGLKFPKNPEITSADLSDIHQVLDLWTGTITSSFRVLDEPVQVTTNGDFETDSVAVTVRSELVRRGSLEVFFDFPYPPIHSTQYKYEVFAGIYDAPLNHTTAIASQSQHDAHILHKLQNLLYYININWADSLQLARDDAQNSTSNTAHRYTLQSKDGHLLKEISFTANFSPQMQKAPPPATITHRNAKGWEKYWEEGGFVDLTESTNPAANELQRRIILSQYHVRVNSAGAIPPQESGLMNNGWYGKFHMEMLVWHLAHWSVWGRQKYFDKILPGIYERFLPTSMERARRQGWQGARWPKMTDPQTGRSSPGGINGLLLWQQPHPMYLATLAYRATPTRETLKKWDQVLTATADYMASYPWLNSVSGAYDLGPPAYGVTENTQPNVSTNLAYEIAYWRYGLDVAREWKKKLGQDVDPQWTEVASHLALPPRGEDGSYVVYQGLNLSFWDDPKLTDDPRSLIMLQGILPDNAAVDPEAALLTTEHVWKGWKDEDIRGWGRPILAINAVRVGAPEQAIFHITNYERWIFDDAGFAVRGGNGGTPPPFMPGNAGFLLAVAYMVVGWDGSTTQTPGFPNDGSWVVRHEGLRQSP